MPKLFDLKRFRKENNLTQKDIAEWFNCGQSNVSMLEKSMGLSDFQKSTLKSMTNIDISKYEIDDIPTTFKEARSESEIITLSKHVLESVLLNLSETLKSQQETIWNQQITIQRFTEQGLTGQGASTAPGGNVMDASVSGSDLKK